MFAQVMDLLPLRDPRRCADRYPNRRASRTFSYLDQFLCMAFAQLTCRENLRDIESCLRAVPAKLYHLGIRGTVSRTTLAYANEHRPSAAGGRSELCVSRRSVPRSMYNNPGHCRTCLSELHRRYNDIRLRWALGGDVVTPTDVYTDKVRTKLPRWQGWAREAKKRLDEMPLKSA